MSRDQDDIDPLEWQQINTPVVPVNTVKIQDGEPALMLLQGGLPGRCFPVGQGVLIGRSPQAEVMLTDPEVSRCHARVWRTLSGEFVVEDLGSINGTFIHGLPVKKRILTFGDKIQIGPNTVLALTHHWPSEGRFVEQQKLEGIGRLAAGVAHEFNNMFAVIRASVDHVIRQSAASSISHSELRECLGDVDEAVQRASAFTRQLMGFSQHVKFSPAPVNLERVISNVLRLARRGAGSRIQIETNVDVDLTVLGALLQLQQVVMNLVLNAVDAMPAGGTLSVAGARLAEAAVVGIPGPTAVLSITDNGTGMNQETLDRVFEPFFTTKTTGKGRGLGMAFSHGVIKAHGGAMEIESAVGVGTSVRIYLPLMELTHDQASAATRRAVPKIAVDDDRQ